MVLRFCERCAAEVEDAGGYCLLGHPLRLDPLIPSVAEIRDEVDRAFDEVRAEQVNDGDPGPPPPPSDGPRGGSVWESLRRETAEPPGDPIEAFAPPPRMDWGPEERSGLMPRALRRRQRVAPA